MKINLKIWVNPATMEPSSKPIEALLTTKEAFVRLQESGLKFEIITPDSPASQHNSYAGMCVLCGDLIRAEIDVAHHIFYKKLDKCHRSCLELALMKENDDYSV